MYKQSICTACDILCISSLSHVLFECNYNKVRREELWNSFIHQCPKALVADLLNMSVAERTVFIINACNSGYVHEFKSIFDSLSNFIYFVHSEYEQYTSSMGV